MDLYVDLYVCTSLDLCSHTMLAYIPGDVCPISTLIIMNPLHPLFPSATRHMGCNDHVDRSCDCSFEGNGLVVMVTLLLTAIGPFPLV